MRPALLLLATIALPGCGGDSKPTPGGTPTEAAPRTEIAPSTEAAGSAESAAPPASPGATAPRARSDALRPTRSPTPLLSLLVNGQGSDAKVVAGWPVVVQLEMASPDGKPWRVAGGSGPWSRLARLEMPGDGPWPFELASGAPAEVTVDERNVAKLFWTIAPEASARLAKGERTLSAVVESEPSGGGAWAGSARSPELRVGVVDEPNPLPPAWAERKAEVEIDFAFCREGAAVALARAEAAAAAQPKSWRLAAMRGNLLAKLERRAEAEAAIERAIDMWHEQHPDGFEPPWELLAMRDALAPTEPAEGAPPGGARREAPPPEGSERPPEREAPEPPPPVEPEAKPLQLSGVVLTPPRGWTREDGGEIPGFRPAADPCRFFVLPLREFHGPSKEAHDGLVAAILADHTPVGAVAAGTRREFRSSAGQIRDAQGRNAWFALYSAGSDGRLASILFQADTRAAYDAHLRSVEAMVDGAAFAGPAKTEELEEAGNLRFARPTGWSRESRDGSVWLMPPGLTPGRQCAVVVAPGEPLTGTARAWFDKTWVELAAGGNIATGELEVTKGDRFDTYVRGGHMERDGRTLVFAVVAFTPGTRIESLVFLADDRELFNAHMPAVDRLVASIGFKSLEVATPGTEAPATSKLEGAWWRLEHAFDPSTRSRDTQHYFLFFYEGGLACRAWNAEGLDGLEPARAMALADEKWGEWGRRSESDGAVTVRWVNGGEATFVRGESGQLREGTSNPYVALPPVDGLALDGLYRYGDGTRIDGASQFEIRFTPEGRFEESSFCSCVHRDGPRAGRGRYRLANYTLHLEYESGERVRIGFFALGRADSLYADDNVFSRAR